MKCAASGSREATDVQKPSVTVCRPEPAWRSSGAGASTLRLQVLHGNLDVQRSLSATSCMRSHRGAALQHKRLKPAADDSLQGKLMEAIEEYHKALALRPEDAFAAEMLGVALREVVPYPDDMGIALGP